MLLQIHWNVHPEVLPGILPVRWYGLLFMSGFVFGYYLLERIFKAEGKPITRLDSFSMYVGIGTILGARLGHCLFYEPAYYLANPIDILKIWEGGLASHGAVIGILLANWLFSQKFKDINFLWVTDRLVIVVALAGCLIRLGNLMNSEIVGAPTEVPWAFIFDRLQDNVPRHPSQLYEAFFYLLSFFVLYRAYWIQKSGNKPGFLLGLFMVMIFGFRFFIEFIKDVQVDFENYLYLNMGQLLSIPVVLIGLWLMWRSARLQFQSPSKSHASN
jgi:phosphatidylglycerol:prolipoprotein diacylglycerol transferase